MSDTSWMCPWLSLSHRAAQSGPEVACQEHRLVSPFGWKMGQAWIHCQELSSLVIEIQRGGVIRLATRPPSGSLTTSGAPKLTSASCVGGTSKVVLVRGLGIAGLPKAISKLIVVHACQPSVRFGALVVAMVAFGNGDSLGRDGMTRLSPASRCGENDEMAVHRTTANNSFTDRAKESNDG